MSAIEGLKTDHFPTSRPKSAMNNEDFKDNTAEEAQKLREASKKVLRFQNSRGSMSSMDSDGEKQKSPLQRQRTIDEDLQSYMDEPSNRDLEKILSEPPSPTKRNLGRRHTLPSKVQKTEETEDACSVSPNRTPEKDDVDSTPNGTSQEESTTAPLPLTEDSSPVENQDLDENVSPKNEKMKTEPTGMLFSFLKRFQFPTAKETTRKSSDSSV